jgi:Domain of unknown function (DUF4330)
LTKGVEKLILLTDISQDSASGKLIMSILDRQGRLFGKISILDIGAALVIMAAVIGIFFIPAGNSSGAIGSNKNEPAEVDVVVRGLNVLDPDKLREDFKPGRKLNFLVRNQPAGSVEIKNVRQLERLLALPLPDGTVKAVKDPRPDSFSVDMIVTVAGQGQSTEGGFTLGGIKVKIGSSVEIDQQNYNFNASVVDVRFGDALKEGRKKVSLNPAPSLPGVLPLPPKAVEAKKNDSKT